MPYILYSLSLLDYLSCSRKKVEFELKVNSVPVLQVFLPAFVCGCRFFLCTFLRSFANCSTLALVAGRAILRIV